MVERRWVLVAAVLTLTALSALILRPIGMQAFEVHTDPRNIEVYGIPGTSEHCVIVTDCETVLTAQTSVDLTQLPLPPLLMTGFAFLVLTTIVSLRKGSIPLISNPPPRFAAL